MAIITISVRYPRPYSQKQCLAITPSEAVDIDVTRTSKIENDAALARLRRGIDLLEIHVSELRL